MDRTYWREIEAWNKNEDVNFSCRCKITDRVCEAFRQFLREKYEYVQIDTLYYNEKKLKYVKRTSSLTVNTTIPWDLDEVED